MPDSTSNTGNNPDSDKAADSDLAEDYLVLLNRHEKQIAAYVHTLLPDPTDAEDILQASRVTLWKRFSDFEPGTNFVAWARKVVLHQVLNHRRSAKRKPLYATDPQVIEAVAAEIDRQSDQLAARSEALDECLQRLPDRQRQTILLRYYEDCEISEIATRTNRTEGAVYRLLSRIRQTLNECVSRKMASPTP